VSHSYWQRGLGPYHGRVIDAETKRPIAGAAVLAVWWERSPGIVNVNISYYDAQETLTDVDGNYTIPGIVITSIDPNVTIEPKFTIYKPRYKALRQSTLKPLPQPPGTPDKYRIQYPFHEEGGHTVVKLAPLKTPKERMDNVSGILPITCRPGDISQFCVPHEKYPNLLKLVNEEELALGLGPSGPVKRSKP